MIAQEFVMPWRHLFALLSISILPAVSAGDSASKILDATDVQGGLVIHLGCGDGRLTATLGAGDSFLVHGLDVDSANVATARNHVKSMGRYGKVSVQQLADSRLPYADNLANLVVSEDLGDVRNDEVMRVLCPGGVAYIKAAGNWQKTVKPWPSDIDEWTHFLHGPDNNAVAHDSVVDVPRQMKWLGEPKFVRAHEQSASFTAWPPRLAIFTWQTSTEVSFAYPTKLPHHGTEGEFEREPSRRIADNQRLSGSFALPNFEQKLILQPVPRRAQPES